MVVDLTSLIYHCDMTLKDETIRISIKKVLKTETKNKNQVELHIQTLTLTFLA